MNQKNEERNEKEMSLNEKKEYLSSILTLEAEVNAKREMISNLHGLLDKLKCLNRTDNEEIIARKLEVEAQLYNLEEDFIKEISKLLYMKTKIIMSIEEIEDPTYKALLELRYISKLTWAEVAEKMFYGEQWVHKLHRKALEVLNF